MGLRLIGRWLYHTITSAEKRPFIKPTLEDLELLTAKAAGRRDILLLFGVLDELKYRVTSPGRRDKLTKRVLSLLTEYEGISISPDAEREEIAKARSAYLREVDQKATEEKRKKTSEARATREAEAKAEREEAERKEAERMAKEAAAADQERLEAEANAKQEEAERKVAERNAKEAAVEKERLEAEAKAKQEEAERKEAERNAKEAAVEKERLEAEAKAKREEAERKEAERKAKEAAAEQERLVAEAKAQRVEAERKEAERKAKEAAAEQERLEAEAKAQREEAERKEAERKAKEAAAEQERLEAKAKAKREEAERKEAERKAKEAAAEKTRLEAEVRLMPDQELNSSRQLEEQAEADARLHEASESDSKTPLTKGITRRLSRKEEREDRRELARLRRLERDGKASDQSEDEQLEAQLDDEIEEAEQFAPYLKVIPPHWSEWSEQHWNIKLLDYCFVQKANESSSQGIPSTEEDLIFVAGDIDSAPADIAHGLVDSVREFSFNHGLSPARLLIKRLETWDYRSAGPPRYFAFLWTTCLIAQGFPSPFEQGEFHKRYERDDVYGANESQSLRRNLPAAWLQLSKWLDRNDIFDSHAHRRLVLPQIDPRRTIISHSWKLSFPCRSDRRRLYEVLGRNRKAHTSRESIDLQLISNIYYQGGFTPEFTAALKQQIDLVQKGNQVEEWFSAIIHREIEAQGTSQVQSARKEKPKKLTGVAPKIRLHLDDEDCYLVLVLPSQSVAIEKPRRLSHKSYCTVTLESKGKMPQVVGELDIDDKLENLIIPEIRVKIDQEQDEYVLRLRHEGLDNAVLTEWCCEGLTNSTPYILFNFETNEIIADEILNGSRLSFLFRRNWDVVLSDGIECESEDPISVSRLGGWRLLLLAKTSQLENHETISLANVTGEKLDICWMGSGDGKSNSRPLLKGLGLPGQATGFVMLADNPEVWLPPGIANIQIEMFKIEDDEFYMPIGSLQVPSTESWQPAGVRKLVTCPGLYSVRLSYLDNSSARMRKWSRHIILAEESNITRLHPASLQARYKFKETSKVLDLERDVSPFVFQESQEFWNAGWLILGLWPHEKIRVNLAGDGENYSQVLSATSSGSCEIPISTFEPYLLSRELARLSIQRQGFVCHYELAVLNGITTRDGQQLPQASMPPTTISTKPKAQKRRLVDTLEIVVYGMRSDKIQDNLVTEVEALIEDGYEHLNLRTIEYPDSKRVPGRRLVFHRISFEGLDNEEKDNLSVGIDSLVGTNVEMSGLDIRAEWSRRRE